MADGVEIIFFEENEIISVGIKLGAKTTREAIVNAATLLMKWQKRLPKWQGNYFKDYYYPRIMRQHDNLNREDHESYSKISGVLNIIVKNILVSYAKFIFEIEKENFITTRDFLNWLSSKNGRKTIPYGVKTLEFRQMLFYYHFAEKFIIDFTADPDHSAEMMAFGIRNARRGEIPFEKDYPISPQQVKNALERWRRVTKVNSDSPLEKGYKCIKEIPHIFFPWVFEMKLFWGYPETEFVDDHTTLPFDLNSYVDPYHLLSE